MIKKIKELWLKAKPIHSVLIFMLVLFASNILWKLCIYGDDTDTQVLLFNHVDISAPFNFMVIHITKVTRGALTLFGYHIHGHHLNDVCFLNENHITIVWGCTAIKQSFIFFCIMACTPGPWKHKLWYVPLGVFIAYLFNLIRIIAIAMVVEQHPEYFKFLHEQVFKYVFYGVIFLVWVVWEEKINLKTKELEG
ncbi:MAG: exosortase/archaeosortase family protein [Paludibacteraceae bacterium]|nr:exosortase/archaeosortase family protein [Paludibacteraceae bacterium]